MRLHVFSAAKAMVLKHSAEKMFAQHACVNCGGKDKTIKLRQKTGTAKENAFAVPVFL